LKAKTSAKKCLAGKLIMVDQSMADNKFKGWLKRLGFLGFMFFFFKGLAWIAVFYFGVKLF
jgi:hypothetical protein